MFVDCTVGLGGHARALLAAGATRLVGLDRDPDALAHRARDARALARSRRARPCRLPVASPMCSTRAQIPLVDGALADLGVSSMQFDAPGRGFSFQRDEPLDMRMDQTQPGDRQRTSSRAPAKRSWPTRFSSSAKSGFPGGSRARLSRRDANRRSTRRHASRRSSAARFRDGDTCASIRRRGRFKRSASG